MDILNVDCFLNSIPGLYFPSSSVSKILENIKYPIQLIILYHPESYRINLKFVLFVLFLSFFKAHNEMVSS